MFVMSAYNIHITQNLNVSQTASDNKRWLMKLKDLIKNVMILLGELSLPGQATSHYTQLSCKSIVHVFYQ